MNAKDESLQTKSPGSVQSAVTPTAGFSRKTRSARPVRQHQTMTWEGVPQSDHMFFDVFGIFNFFAFGVNQNEKISTGKEIGFDLVVWN